METLYSWVITYLPAWIPGVAYLLVFGLTVVLWKKRSTWSILSLALTSLAMALGYFWIELADPPTVPDVRGVFRILLLAFPFAVAAVLVELYGE